MPFDPPDLSPASRALWRLAGQSPTEREGRALTAALDALPEAINVYDADWRWVHINPAAAEWLRTLGRDPATLVGRRVQDEFDLHPDSEILRAAERAVRERRETHHEARYGSREYLTRIVPFPGGALSLTRDVGRERREERHRRFMAEAGALLNEVSDPDRLLASLARVTTQTFADSAVAYRVRGERLLRVGFSDVRPENERILARLEQIAPVGTSAPLVRRAFEKGAPLHLRPAEMFERAVNDEHEGLLRELAQESLLLIPMVVRGREFGMLLVATSTGGRPPLDEDDARVLLEVVRRVEISLALEEARRDALAAAGRMERIQRVMAALATPLPLEETLDVLVREAVGATGAYMGAVCSLDPDAQEITLIRQVGLSDEVAERFRRIPYSYPGPVGEVARTGEPVFIGDAREWTERYGSRPQRNAEPVEEGAWTALPLRVQERLAGLIVLGFERSVEFTQDDRNFLTALAHQCAQALDAARRRSELDLERRRLRAVLDLLPAGVWIAGRDGSIIETNRAAQELWGGAAPRSRQAAEYHMEYVARWPDGRRLEEGEWGLARALRGEATGPEEVVIECFDGTTRTILNYGIPVETGDASLEGAVALSLDITDRKRVEEDLRRASAQLEILFRTTRVLLAAEHPTDAIGEILSELRRIFGVDVCFHYMVEQEGGGPIRLRLRRADGMSEADAERYEVYELGQVLCGIPARERRPFIVQEGEETDEGTDREAREAMADIGIRAYAGYPLAVGPRLLGTIAFGMRERGRFEPHELDLLETVAEQLAVAIDRALILEAEHRARRTAEEANQAKSAFMATVSHELRTPLNAVIGYTDLLTHGIPEVIGERPLGQVRRIGVAARHLLQLIEEVLTFSRLDAGRERVQFEDVHLDSLMDEVRTVARPLAAEAGLSFRVLADSGPTVVRTDPRKLRQVLLNLLGNAVKFTRRGEVSLEVVRAGSNVLFTVRDTGIGIAAADLPHLFDPFWQADATSTREAQGTGLGLTICQRFAELLGGTIEVDSEPDAGSAFTLRVPSA